MRVHLFELLGSSERKWGVAGVWKIYPVELQDRARLHFPYTTYYHVESVLQKRLKRQDHPLLIVSISIYNSLQRKITSCVHFEPVVHDRNLKGDRNSNARHVEKGN